MIPRRPYFHCNGEIIFFKFGLEPGGPLDFAHPTAAPVGGRGAQQLAQASCATAALQATKAVLTADPSAHGRRSAAIGGGMSSRRAINRSIKTSGARFTKYLTIMPKLRSTYDGRLILQKHPTKGARLFLSTIHLQSCKIV